MERVVKRRPEHIAVPCPDQQTASRIGRETSQQGEEEGRGHGFGSLSLFLKVLLASQGQRVLGGQWKGNLGAQVMGSRRVWSWLHAGTVLKLLQICNGVRASLVWQSVSNPWCGGLGCNEFNVFSIGTATRWSSSK